MGKTNFAPKLIKTKRNPHAHLGTNLGVWEPSNLEDQITHRNCPRPTGNQAGNLATLGRSILNQIQELQHTEIAKPSWEPTWIPEKKNSAFKSNKTHKNSHACRKQP